jgi:hypothetical protein
MLTESPPLSISRLERRATLERRVYGRRVRLHTKHQPSRRGQRDEYGEREYWSPTESENETCRAARPKPKYSICKFVLQGRDCITPGLVATQLVSSIVSYHAGAT